MTAVLSADEKAARSADATAASRAVTRVDPSERQTAGCLASMKGATTADLKADQSAALSVGNWADTTDTEMAGMWAAPSAASLAVLLADATAGVMAALSDLQMVDSSASRMAASTVES